jgi:hypothetical protein
MFEKFLSSATSITILRIEGTDTIQFFFEGAPSPYPELAAEQPNGYNGVIFSVETRRGYAEEWLKVNKFVGKVQLITKSGASEIQID